MDQKFKACLIAIFSFLSCLSSAGTYKILHSFSGGADGSVLYSGVTLDKRGNLFGVTAGGGNTAGTVFELIRGSGGIWTKATIYTFDFQTDGGDPTGALVFDAEGNLYGTTSNGGPQHFGTVFQLVPSPSGEWTLNVLYDAGSSTGLTLDLAGNLYGLGDGAFEISPGPGGWNYQQIYDFSREHDAGGFYAPMILDPGGNLIGTSLQGGNPYPKCSGAAGCGMVFKLHPNPDETWTEHILHKFAAWKYDGQYAQGGVVRDAAGNLYGTALEGGTHRNGGVCLVGCGTIYKLSRQPDGRWREDILYNFPNKADGLGPSAGPILDAGGNLYGTAGVGGDSHCGCGVVYKLSPQADGSWTYTVLHRFKGTDGAGPVAPLVMDKKGNLYGTTVTGGPGGYGVVFKIAP